MTESNKLRRYQTPANDCVRLVPPGAPPGMLQVGSSTGAWVDLRPLDNQLDGGGFANFSRTYPQLTVALLTASPTHEGRPFVGWRINGGELIRELSIPLVIVGVNQTARAVYRGDTPTLENAATLD